ncbi:MULTISPECIES: Cys-rich protein [Leptospira]|jgi:Cys-rich protein (TIGR04453 family)|uniref:Cys-rich protein n=4 Tax=Leptospira TaxID=171 RepID=A0A2M9YNI6_9LEPT|nr:MULTISPECIES: Cys-rich protein [Leptospira]AOP33306.1 Cys-rich protein [Leptospira tipperaryensis]MBM9577143.1 Cys-rich protein [Leptospira ainlahdjerensis]PJZ53030.1 Cys-rich protein [Leptospira adleri]PJZ62587.1 Cys-rich protein [Leptospira adleri]RHX86804.1 Cys-rich protein [Leptospira stimsonii]
MNPRRILLFLLLTILPFVSCQEYVQQKCSSACKFFVQCAVTTFKDVKVTELEKNQAMIDCESGCIREQSFVLPCFESETTCKGFNTCVLESGFMD